MAADNVAIRNAILTKLQGVGSLSVAYGAEQVPVDGKYPFATVVMANSDAKVGDTLRNIRTHRFFINIYQERTATGFGNQKAEDVVLAVCDEIETAFDADITLSGVVKWVKPIRPNMSHIIRDFGDIRMAQYTVEAVSVTPLGN